MRKLLNTLYITLPDSYLACDGENVLVKINGEIKFRVPIHNLEGIVCFGYAGASPGLMELCCERGVSISFLTHFGKFIGRVSGRISGNVLLRRTQYRWSDDFESSLRLSKRFLLAKVINSRSVLHRAIRDHSQIVDTLALSKSMDDLSAYSNKLITSNDMDSLRGIEGLSAASYFSVFNHLILNQKDDFCFTGRNRRPPTDRVNSLLSFLYTLLSHETAAALESVGLDPQVGFLHKDRPGRLSLSLDLMEELRPHFADRLALTLINRNQIDGGGFTIKENGTVIMDDKTRKEVLLAWQKRKQEEIVHPFIEEKIQFGLVPYVQAMLLSRHLRGDLEDYPPFFWK
ncbi:type I-C CRISPR-associated endonuclease Cas1c [Youngiibacter fragilis]|uniref:CRISPR-associated endonuclease Cas1 n=1 Tax=Youngiibacter fragilis 232.1 TaxID=994573 RepID=V7I481_9CLOT|nr:type I-C CRISPR-associated endonuclease Cas1c [Youngiibacter fragilis]ETA80086.1 CRISPR-associated protein Cas1 [Youngiibacter fragilis 232.1]